MDPFQQSHPPASRFRILILLAVFASAAHCGAAPFASWEKTLTPSSQSPFPPIAPFVASYRFGWQGIPAGGAEVQVQARPSGRRGITAQGGPNQWVRKLWNYEASYEGEAGMNGQAPSWFKMQERTASCRMLSEAWFPGGSFLSCRRRLDEMKDWKREQLPGIRDLFSAMLFVRSQPLKNGDRLRLTVYPDQNPYFVELTVSGREMLLVNKKPTRAIRFQIHIQSIEMQGEHKGRLVPHRIFRSGRVWMSDDADRMPLRAEVDLAIGHVFAELTEWNKLP